MLIRGILVEDSKAVYDFYNAGAEVGRLERGLGKIEFYRTKEVLAQYISKCSTIYDIGGGIGVYASWLAKQGNHVHLIELADYAIEYAKKNMMQQCSFSAEVGDARHLNKPSHSADIVLMMGPLYHLQNKEDRQLVLNEAYRVLKDDGLLIAAGISKYSSMTWALSTYGTKNNLIDESVFRKMIKEEVTSGNHNRPLEYPYLIAQAYFSTPESMASEIKTAGFAIINKHAVEGCIWFTPCLDEKWENEQSRKNLLELIHMTEHESEMMGMSPHFLVVAKKANYKNETKV